MRATGLAEMLDQSRTGIRAETIKLSDQVMRGLIKDADALGPGYREEIMFATRRFAETCVESLDVDEAVASWGRFYAEALSDEELDEILRFYSSPIGQKDVAATKAALPIWNAHLQSRSAALMQVALEKYTEDLREIMRRWSRISDASST